LLLLSHAELWLVYNDLLLWLLLLPPRLGGLQLPDMLYLLPRSHLLYDYTWWWWGWRGWLAGWWWSRLLHDMLQYLLRRSLQLQTRYLHCQLRSPSACLHGEVKATSSSRACSLLDLHC
jgi:hypothetical protein